MSSTPIVVKSTIMRNHVKWIQISVILISVAFFILIAIPNAKASENIAMVSMFEPDEGIMIPVIRRMTSPKDTAKDFITNFLFYKLRFKY